jgi:hypothetical protein
MIRSIRKFLVICCALALASFPQALLACSACFGVSDSNQAKGMNAGIFALLGVVVVVLGGVAAFFVFLVRRANTPAVTSQNLLGKEIS